MVWTNLASITLNQSGEYASVPVGASGGAVTFLVPAFASGGSGRYKIGAYSGPPENPQFIEEKTFDIRPYARHVTLTYPANLAQPLVGLQLTDHAEITTASYPVVLQWQAAQSSSLPQGAQVSLGITIESLKASILQGLTGASVSYTELEALLEGLESLISDDGGTGPEGPEGPEGPAGEVTTAQLNAAIDALREELEMIGTPESAEGAEGNAAIITLLPPGVGLQYALLNVDFSYGPNTGDISGILSVTNDGGASFVHKGAVTSSGEGPVPKGALMGENNAVTIQLSGVAGSPSYINAVYKVVAV